MMSGKSQGSTQPYAYGSLLQASTYGQTIPVIYGMTLSPLLAIWAANLRQGSGSGKKFKSLKKNSVDYCENIDFLIGHNPIIGINQMWNNGATIPLNFTSYTHTGTLSAVTIPDSNFYAVIGVSIEDSYSVTFDDYGGQGVQHYSGNYQIPCWNELHNGPDPTHSSALRNYPYCYRWEPGYGATIYFDFPEFFIYTVTIYYAQLTSATSNQPPITRQRLAFEAELGSGTEYSDAGLSAQQIIYPMYAGAGSSDIDLGSGGVIPQLQAEVQGKFGLYSTGDCDFADMIEDVFKSGVAQAAIGATSGASTTTQLQHGLGCYRFPGCIQAKTEGSIYGVPGTPYNMPTTAGNILLVLASNGGSATLSISDTGGNTWTPIFSVSLGVQAWYATAVGGPSTVTISWVYDSSHLSLFEIAGDVVLDSISIGANGAATITTTNTQGYGAYMLGVGLWTGPVSPQDPHIPNWHTLLCDTTSIYWQESGAGTSSQLVVERNISTPGTFQLQLPSLGGGVGYPKAMCIIAFKAANPPTYPDPFEDFIDISSLDQVRLQCRANGLWGSLSMNSQQAASDWLKLLYSAANATPVFAGFKLFSQPLSEVSFVGNGVTYNAPTASGPSYALSTANGDFLNSNDNPIELKTVSRVDQPNVLQMQCINRTSNYNPSVVEQPEAASISLYGVRKQDPVQNYAIQDVSIARLLLGIQVRVQQYGGDTYTFTLPAKWCLLAPYGAGGGGNSDAVILISDPLANINNFPVRITSIQEDDNQQLQCDAEPFVYGMYAPQPLPADTPTPYSPSVNTVPGNINAPIIFEPIARLYGNANQAQLWIVISSNEGSAFGGVVAYVSTDGGASYNPTGGLPNPSGAAPGTTVGSAVTGYTTANWAASASPDTTNNLPVTVAESEGEIQSISSSEQTAALLPCYVASASGSIPYELMTYGTATLTGANTYTLEATGTGNYLGRGVFGAPSPGQGVYHASGSRFAVLDPSMQGIIAIALPSQWIGVTLYFKFPAINSYGTAAQSLSGLTAYSYTPTGLASGAVNSQQYTLQPNPATITQTTPTLIQVSDFIAIFPLNPVQYNPHNFTIPAPSVPTWYYITIADPGQVGDNPVSTSTLVHTCQTSNALVGVPGNTYVGAILALPAGGATEVLPGGWTTPQSFQVI